MLMRDSAWLMKNLRLELTMLLGHRSAGDTQNETQSLKQAGREGAQPHVGELLTSTAAKQPYSFLLLASLVAFGRNHCLAGFSTNIYSVALNLLPFLEVRN